MNGLGVQLRMPILPILTVVARDLLRSPVHICLEPVWAAFLCVYSGPNKLVDPFPSPVQAFEPGVPKISS